MVDEERMLGEVVLPGNALAETQAFFTGLGFRVEAVRPADDPREVVLSGQGLRLRLDRDFHGGPGRLRLANPDGPAPPQQAPNGTEIHWIRADSLAEPAASPAPEPGPVLSRANEAVWTDGRAGMRYRDLDSSRQGGRLVASHIHIGQAGRVDDYVHYHELEFQMIYCWRGWVRVAYESQGDAFVLEPGDCVLQPPGIRHRVMESSAGLDVVELSSPADHPTHADHDTYLPAPEREPARRWDGQRFVRFQARAASWRREQDWDVADTGIGEASAGRGEVHMVRVGPGHAADGFHENRTTFWFVTSGSGRVMLGDAGERPLMAGDALVVPPGTAHRLNTDSGPFLLLRARLSVNP